MKNKNVLIFVTVIGIMLVFTGSSLAVFNLINKQNKEKREQQKIIIDNHGVFKEEIEEFNQARSEYFEVVSSNLFLETIEEYDNWINILNNYTSVVDKVEEKSSKLKNACINQFYSSMDVRNKCDSFVIAYETAINYYTKDIISFNESIKEFNKSLDNKLNEYELKYEFVDINDDGKYYGKE